MEENKSGHAATGPCHGAKVGHKAVFATAEHDHDYTPDEMEFLRAMDAYKTSKRRPFPSWVEVLGVLVSLGYHR
jgi:hypothetical protein